MWRLQKEGGVYRHIGTDTCRDAVQGKANLVIETRVATDDREATNIAIWRATATIMSMASSFSEGGSLSCHHQTNTVPAQ
jgi:hypothetical protein